MQENNFLQVSCGLVHHQPISNATCFKLTSYAIDQGVAAIEHIGILAEIAPTEANDFIRKMSWMIRPILDADTFKKLGKNASVEAH